MATAIFPVASAQNPRAGRASRRGKKPYVNLGSSSLVDIDKIILYLAEAAQTPIAALHRCCPEPPPLRPVYLHPAARISLVLQGEAHFKFGANNRREDRRLTVGEALIMEKGAWTETMHVAWCRMLGIVFFEDFVRVLYDEHDGVAPAPLGPTFYYHSIAKLCPAGELTVRALLACESDGPEARLLLAATLEFVRNLLLGEKDASPTKSPEWKRVRDILQRCFTLDMSREQMAQLARMHPAQLSRLVKKHAGLKLCDYIEKLRLDYARELLRQPDPPVGEVAARCGYRYANYFIRRFRRAYGDTPHRFRSQFRPEQAVFEEKS